MHDWTLTAAQLSLHMIGGISRLLIARGAQSNPSIFRAEGLLPIETVAIAYVEKAKAGGLKVPNGVFITNIVLGSSGGQMANEPLPVGPFIGFTIDSATKDYPIPAPKGYAPPRWADFNEAVERLKNPNILIFCLGVFSLGSLLDVLAVRMEKKEPSQCSPSPVNREVKQQTKTREPKQ